jgi:hypothetical protein
MKIVTIFLTLWIITLNIGWFDHVSPAELQGVQDIESHISDQSDSKSLSLNDHCESFCSSMSCHSGFCHMLTKANQLEITGFDFASTQINSNFNKPKSPYLEGNKRPPKLS